MQANVSVQIFENPAISHHREFKKQIELDRCRSSDDSIVSIHSGLKKIETEIPKLSYEYDLTFHHSNHDGPPARSRPS